MKNFSNTEQVSKVGLEIIGKSLENDRITCFEILSYAYNTLHYAYVIVIFLMLLTYTITHILQ